MKGGFGGFPNDISDVMQGSIYAYILCMALAYRMYHDIYIMTTRGQLSEEIRHAVTAALKSPAAAHFAELRSFRRGWMALRAFQTPFRDEHMTSLFFYGMGIAVVL